MNFQVWLRWRAQMRADRQLAGSPCLRFSLPWPRQQRSHVSVSRSKMSYRHHEVLKKNEELINVRSHSKFFSASNAPLNSEVSASSKEKIFKKSCGVSKKFPHYSTDDYYYVFFQLLYTIIITKERQLLFT